MIRLQRLDGGTLVVDPDLIELIEEVPETMLTLVDGSRLFVEDPPETVIETMTRRSAAGPVETGSPSGLRP